jgi:hypothetical protein
MTVYGPHRSTWGTLATVLSITSRSLLPFYDYYNPRKIDSHHSCDQKLFIIISCSNEHNEPVLSFCRYRREKKERSICPLGMHQAQTSRVRSFLGSAITGFGIPGVGLSRYRESRVRLFLGSVIHSTKNSGFSCLNCKIFVN